MSNTVINTNVSALNSHRAILGVSNRQATSSERLSTGMRINRAADDAAGLAISEKMRNQIRGLDQAVRNSQDGISLVQTAEGAMEEIHRILERVRELTVQASNDTYTNQDRDNILTEIDQILQQVDHIAERTEFNTQTLLEGDGSGGDLTIGIQSGANAAQRMTINISDMSLEGLGLDDFVDDFEGHITPLTGSGGGSNLSGMITELDAAITTVSTQRAELGAFQNRLEHTVNNLQVSSENLSAANSRIRDTDMAQEMMRFTQANILQQAGLSMLAQANQAPQSVLQLL